MPNPSVPHIAATIASIRLRIRAYEQIILELEGIQEDYARAMGPTLATLGETAASLIDQAPAPIDARKCPPKRVDSFKALFTRTLLSFKEPFNSTQAIAAFQVQYPESAKGRAAGTYSGFMARSIKSGMLRECGKRNGRHTYRVAGNDAAQSVQRVAVSEKEAAYQEFRKTVPTPPKPIP